MTKEITKSVILQQIQDKFKLREFTPAKFLFDETVIPVYDIAKQLEEWWTKYVEVSVTGTGGVLFFTVPQNEKWKLRSYDVIFMGAGGYTISGVYLGRVHCDPSGAKIYLDMEAAKSASYHIALKQDVILEPGDDLRIYVDGFTSTQALRLYIDYMVEEIR